MHGRRREGARRPIAAGTWRPPRPGRGGVDPSDRRTRPQSALEHEQRRGPHAARWLGERVALGTDGIGADMSRSLRWRTCARRERTPYRRSWPLARLAAGPAAGGSSTALLAASRPAHRPNLVVLDYAAAPILVATTFGGHWIYGLSSARCGTDGRRRPRRRDRPSPGRHAALVAEARRVANWLWSLVEEIEPHPIAPSRLLATRSAAPADGRSVGGGLRPPHPQSVSCGWQAPRSATGGAPRLRGRGAGRVVAKRVSTTRRRAAESEHGRDPARHGQYRAVVGAAPRAVARDRYALARTAGLRSSSDWATPARRSPPAPSLQPFGRCGRAVDALIGETRRRCGRGAAARAALDVRCW